MEENQLNVNQNKSKILKLNSKKSQGVCRHSQFLIINTELMKYLGVSLEKNCLLPIIKKKLQKS